MRKPIAFMHALKAYFMLDKDMLAMNELPLEKSQKTRMLMAKIAYNEKLKNE